jgi:prepilin-type N-terminal cleavage/methylation domain-containing protein
MGKENRQRRGFTLLEMLMAMALVSIISFSLYSSLSLAYRARKQAEAAVNPYMRLAPVFEMMRAEILCAITSENETSLAGSFVGKNSHVSDLDTDRIGFFTTGCREDDKSGSIVFVSYYVDDINKDELTLNNDSLKNDPEHADDSSLVLYKEVLGNPLSVSGKGDVSIVSRSIVSLNAEYYDGSVWKDEWDSDEMEYVLPRAVRITLSLGEKDTETDEYKTYSRVYVLSVASEEDASEQGE